jgi:hypothetical protein
MHIEADSGIVFRSGILEVPLALATADLRQNQDQIDLLIPNAQIGQGQCSVTVQQIHANAALESELSFTRVSLSDLRIRSPLLTGWQGELSGWLKTRFDGTDSNRDRTEGNLVLDSADLSKPQFVEPGFKKLMSAGFNRLGRLDAEFVADFGIVRVTRLSFTSGEHVLDLSGSLDLTTGAAQLSGHLDQDAAITRVSGPIVNPDWEIAVPHRD